MKRNALTFASTCLYFVLFVSSVLTCTIVVYTFLVKFRPGNMDSNPEIAASFSGDEDVGPERSAMLHEHEQSSVNRRLYVSHFLSTCNSRVFEFGAVLYLASIFPGTLLPMSVYALARSVSAILFSPVIGRYIDKSERLWVVRLSIVSQRLAVAASCCIFWLLATGWEMKQTLRLLLLSFLIVLAGTEKLASIMNLISVERDWVIVIAEGDQPLLRELNSRMRRIDLICKLGGPFAIAMLNGISTKVAITFNFTMNIASIIFEYHAIARVYDIVPRLKEPKVVNLPIAEPFPEISHFGYFAHTWSRLKELLARNARDLGFYLRHRAFLPSLSVSLLYLTVLSFSGQMITYLLSSGYNSTQIGFVRTLSVALEITATWLAPFAMSRIGPIRAGMWFISWQMICLAVATCIFWSHQNEDAMFSASALLAGIILSRVGLWGFDLATQVIIQQEVDPEHRGAFSSIEASFQNAFELLSYTMTVVFADPTQFRWPALVSCAAIFAAGGLYSQFVRSRRGHLFHFSTCVEGIDCHSRPRGHEYKAPFDGLDYGGVGQHPCRLYYTRRDIR